MDYEVCSDTIIRPIKDANRTVWIASNPRVRSHFQIDVEIARGLMTATQALPKGSWIDALSHGSGYARSCFSNSQGLLADPTGFGPIKGNALQGEALFDALLSSWILCPNNDAAYSNYLGPKTSLLEKNHLGSFHQALGRYQLVEMRIKDNWRWWHDQKFATDGKSIRPSLYKWVQENFFDAYFTKEALSEKRILDFGCGNGYYSDKFHRLGANVTGVDTSAELLEIARKNWSKDIQFMQPASGQASQDFLGTLDTASFDRIYISDTLLFFFFDLKSRGRRSELLDQLLTQFRRLLKEDGSLYVMESNGIFWLTPWFGSSDRPYTVINEYRNRVYHVAPTPDQVIAALAEAGFAVGELVHPSVSEECRHIDPMAYGFAKEFPLWDFYRAIPR